MTPKLKLKEEERKALLSWILKLRFPGKRRMIKSTQMILAPTTQAEEREHMPSPGERAVERIPMPLTQAIIHPRVSLSSTMMPSIVLATRAKRRQGKPPQCSFDRRRASDYDMLSFLYTYEYDVRSKVGRIGKAKGMRISMR